MGFFRRLTDKQRRSRQDRRVLNDPTCEGPSRRSGIEPRSDQVPKRFIGNMKSKYDKLTDNQKRTLDKIISSPEKDDG